MATLNKKANIHSAMARFEATISKNNETGVESKMFLSTIAKNRPTMGRRGGSKQMIVPSRLSRVPETASSITESTASSTIIMESVHSRESSVGMGSVHSRASSVGMVVGMGAGEDWGNMEVPDDDPWADNDDDDFGDFGGGDDFGGDGDDDWQNCSVASNSVASTSQNEQTETPKLRGVRKPTSSRPKMAKASSSSTSKTFMLTGSSPVSSVDGPASPPSRRTHSSKPRSGPSKSKLQTQDSDNVSPISTESRSKKAPSRSVSSSADIAPHSTESRSRRAPSRSASSDDCSVQSMGSRSTKAPSRSFRHKPSSGDEDDCSVSSSKKKLSRSSRPEGSSTRKLPLSSSSSSSRRLSPKVSS
jgi:hypothetical protein